MNHPVGEQLAEVQRQIQRSLAPVLQTLKKLAESAAPLIKTLQRWDRAAGALNKVGWLPYYSVPFHHIEECVDDLPILDSRLDNYYLTHWNEIRNDMESRLADCHIDDEAAATFCEALAAHEAGYYRCVCRVLFPEIERMIQRIPSTCKRMPEKLNTTAISMDITFKQPFDYVLFGYLVHHVYQHVPENDREGFKQNPIPNRHAAMHGMVVYSAHKNSMNMLILTDYVFRILPHD